jgi:hypothetical protein
VSKSLAVSEFCPGVGLVAAFLAVGAPASRADDAADWLVEDRARVLHLRLAHAERPRPDGGVLVVDPNRRVVTWEGIPGDLGCRQKLEVPFARIRAVRDEPEGVLRLEVKGEPRDRWVFVPLPHAAWLTRASSRAFQGFGPELRDSFVGPDGFPMPASGAALFGGVQLRPDIVPVDVLSDVRLAVEHVRQGLGRTALPSVEVYETLHGRPVEVAIAELVSTPGAFEGRAVRVRGVATSLPRDRGLELADGDARLHVVPQPEIAALVRAGAREWGGQEVEVAGVVRAVPGSADGPTHEVAFWEYQGPDRTDAPGDDARTVRIRDLVERSAELAGQTVRVVGKFRGRNLFHDLEEPGPGGAWVLKSGRHAAWIVGHGPSGRGFRLDPHLVRDATRWLEVVGRVESKDGLTVLRARAVALSAPASFVWSGPRLRTGPRPDVVFTLPLADEELPVSGARLLVQFSAYMDEESFEGHVQLRYGGEGAGQELERLRWSYDDVRRVLVLDPGEPLRAGAEVEVRLLPGILDVHATPLEPLAGAGPGDPARVLRWRVSPGPAAEAEPRGH